MKNPFKIPFKKRGLPDSAFHGGNPPPPQNPPVQPISDALIPISDANPTVPSTSAAPNGYSHTLQPEPPTAYPYEFQPEEKEAGPVWEFNTGNNKNIKGQQKAGNIRAANGVAGSALPQAGRFVFNTGNNHNEGDSQECGYIEFGNVG